MKVVLFGATGMIGQGVLRECLLEPGVDSVLAVGRVATGLTHPKLHELPHRDFLDFSTIAGDLAGYDACFFCLGVSSARMTEPDYRRVTFDMPMAAPLYPLLRALLPRDVTTTEQIGRAMIAVALRGAPTRVLENPDINAVQPPHPAS